MLNKNTISMILSMYLPMIMHHKGHPLRNSAIENLRAIGFIPLHEQDDQVINNQMMSAVVQFCLNWGIFDYKSAYECMQKYRENSHNIAPFVPYLVDKIADGMLISLGGVAGKFLGWKVAEQLFPDPQPVGGQPFPLVAAV
jgi:hypothetical protein